jgi:hypothetical protein
VTNLIPIDGVRDRLVVGLVRELRRMHAYHDQHVAVLGLKWVQFVQDV